VKVDFEALIEAEQRARRQAEMARDRTRRLQELTSALSGAIEKTQVASILVDAGRAALGAAAGFVWLERDHDTLELVAQAHDGRRGELDRFSIIPRGARMPVCAALASGQPILLENIQAMVDGYPDSIGPAQSPFRSWAVMPLMARGKGIGAASFSFADERLFSDDDRELLAAITGQAALALERSLLLEAERRARMEAEVARQRERQLHQLAARLSRARTPREVATLSSQEVLDVLGAHSAGVAVRVGDAVQFLGISGVHDPQRMAKLAHVPVDAPLPQAEAIHRNEVVWVVSQAELAARYPHLEESWRSRGTRAWGAVPFRYEGRAIGAVSLSFTTERDLSGAEREFLFALGELTAQALERARLYEALQKSEEELQVALTAARAATWSVDLRTMSSTRNVSYQRLLELPEALAPADFGAIHPDDRATARAALDRAVRDGVPYTPEIRVRRGDGTYTWVRSHGRVIKGPDGQPAMVAGVIVDIDEQRRASLRADEERRINETLNRLGWSFGSELDQGRLVQLITDEISKLVGAELGAFFQATGGDDSYALVTVSSSSADRFGALRRPRATPLLAETLVDHRPVRLDDVTQDPRFGADGAQPAGHPRVRSYLAVPVVARTGEVYGSLLFGHPEPGRFTADHERLAISIAAQATVALENARLYTTVRQQKEQLEEAVERARLADRRKDEFLAMLGHELRNPLAPIATALDLMNLKGSTALTQEREVIRRQVDHLARLVDDLLDVSRITRGKIQLIREPVEVAAVLAKAIEMASPLFEKRMQELSIDVPLTGLGVEADPTRLAQVFHNLLTNASKYSEPRTRITLRARGVDGQVIVEVQDQGMGISADLLPDVFDVFVQGQRAIDRSEGGLGLGLAIAKSLCELHGGRIQASSSGPGSGSTFTVMLPAAGQPSAVAFSAPPAPPVQTAGRVRVLVVDDNIDAAQTLHEFLAFMGHDAAVAHDGVAALELASSFRPQVAVLDIGLPVMDGYELARRLRAQQAGAELRLIAVTGYGQENDRLRSREAGFDHHLVKPIALDALIPLLAPEPSP
jgi:K+-sensing histidine kinase KdpD